MVASVPELTSRSRSTGATRSMISAASSVSDGSRGAEAQAVGRHLLHRFDHGRVGVAQEHRAPGADQVDVAVVVRIRQPVALGRGDEPGVPPTELKARTGEFTPPGITAQASANSWADR